MLRTFADLSSNQPSADLRAYARAGHLAVGLKATEGADFTDPRYMERVQEAHRLGLAVIHYHFARPDRHVDPRPEVAFFTATIRPFFHTFDVAAWDQEVASDTLSAPVLGRYARRAHADLRELGHPRSVGYSYLDYIAHLGQSWPWQPGRTWLADDLRLRRSPLGGRLFAHQFTDGIRGPVPHTATGIGRCDLSRLNGRSFRRLARRARARHQAVGEVLADQPGKAI